MSLSKEPRLLTVSVLAGVFVLAATNSSFPQSAGGVGGGGYNAAGATTGNGGSAVGGISQAGGNSASGSGGGAAGTVGVTVSSPMSLSGLSGVAGGDGAADFTRGAGGGAGGYGAIIATSGQISIAGMVTGGAGGSGGNGTIVAGGGGGGGGGGIFAGLSVGPDLIVTVMAAGSVAGGVGGAGGQVPGLLTGNYGQGGAGVEIYGGGILNNAGSISGGNGVSSGFLLRGVPGVGVAGANLYVINSGSILPGFGFTPANAIVFTGGTNTLEIRSGSTIAGQVVAVASGADTLALGGATNATFSIEQVGAQYLNFASFTKIGTSTWTLTGNGTFAGPTTVNGGTLVGGNTNAFSPASATTINVNGTLDLGGFNQTVSALSGAGLVTNNGSAAAVLTNLGASSTFSGVIADGASTVSVTQNAAGSTLTLSGANTYSGATTVTAGTLKVAARHALGLGSPTTVNLGGTLDLNGFDQQIAALSGAGLVTNNGSVARILVVNAQASTTFSGVIADGISKIGLLFAGFNGHTLTLRGANTYTGATTVEAAPLIGGAANTFSAGSNTTVYAGGTLDLGGFAQTINTLLIAGGTLRNGSLTTSLFGLASSGGTFDNITGSLTLITLGGTSVFTGTNIFGSVDNGGGTTIVNNGTTTDSLSNSGIVINNGTYTANVTSNGTIVNSGTWTGDIANTGGTFTQTSGSTLNGVLTNQGPATIAGAVGGIVNSSSLTIQGTVTVNGTTSFLPGSTLVVSISPNGTNDKLSVTGPTSISTGTVLQVVANPGAYNAGQKYVVITATGGISGTFTSLIAPSSATLVGASAFLNTSVGYDANDVYFALTQAMPLPAAANTPNQTWTAQAIQSLGTAAPLTGLVLTQTTAGARQLFDALSGEIHASAVSAALDTSGLPREAMLNRLTALQTPTASGYEIWTQGFGDWGNIRGNGNAASVSTTVGGVIAGIDLTAALPSGQGVWRAGLAVGYTGNSLTVSARASSGSVGTTFGAIYGGATISALNLRAGVLFGGQSIHTSHNTIVAGAETADYGGTTTQAFAEAGWGFDLGRPNLSVEPFAGVAVIHLAQNGYVEAGSALASLQGARQTYNYTTSTLGARGAMTMAGPLPLPLTISGLVGWRHAYGGSAPAVTNGSPARRRSPWRARRSTRTCC